MEGPQSERDDAFLPFCRPPQESVILIAVFYRAEYSRALDKQVADRKARDEEAVKERRQVFQPVHTDTIEKQAW